jgi:tetratricopeptide (TPR) repeat protein
VSGQSPSPSSRGRESKARSCFRAARLAMAVLLLGLSAFAADVSTEFDSANKLYEQGRFAEAAAAYEKMIESGRASAAVYFNLGNARFKSGETGRALAAYRQAGRIAPRDPDIRANVQFVRSQVQGPTLPAGRWQHWLGRLTVNEWTVLAAAACWLWLLLLATLQFRPALKQSLRGPVWAAGLAAAALVVCAGAVLSFDSGTTAIVITRDAVVHSGPLEEAQRVFTVRDGAELSVSDRKNDWLQVGAGDRRIGWLKREQVILAR